MKRNRMNLGVIFLICTLALNFSPDRTSAQSPQRPFTIYARQVEMSAAASALGAHSLFTVNDAKQSGVGIGTLPGLGQASDPDDEAELSIDLDASADTVVTGSNVTYTITVTNEGPGFASAFTVADELPSEVSFVSCETSGAGLCGGSGNKRTVFFNTLAPDTTATITLVATVNCPVADGTDIANTAELQFSTPVPEDDENDSETVVINASNPLPLITGVAVNPPQLWPPNHRLINVAVNYKVKDNCGPVTTRLSVASNEAVNGTGDGDTAPDWEIANEHLVRLRAERAGNGNGRIYTITITATDSAGQSSRQAVTVNVPKNQK